MLNPNIHSISTGNIVFTPWKKFCLAGKVFIRFPPNIICLIFKAYPLFHVHGPAHHLEVPPVHLWYPFSPITMHKHSINSIFVDFKFRIDVAAIKDSGAKK